MHTFRTGIFSHTIIVLNDYTYHSLFAFCILFHGFATSCLAIALFLTRVQSVAWDYIESYVRADIPGDVSLQTASDYAG